jgi:tetratricopeptide (TPR) repeat protein
MLTLTLAPARPLAVSIASVLAVLVCLPPLSLHGSEIHTAVKKRDTKAVTEILKKDPKAANSVTAQRMTPLHIAAAQNDTQNAFILISYGANPLAQTDTGITPLQAACRKNATNVVSLLIKRTNVAYTDTFLGSKAPANQDAKQWRRDIEKARNILSQLFRKDPGNEHINFAYGMACAGIGSIPRAKFAFERVVEINPKNQRARMELAQALIDQRQVDMAREQLKLILKHNPKGAVRQVVNRYLRSLDAGGGKWSFSCSLTAGGFSDDNLNVGPNSSIIDITPITFGAALITELILGEASLPLEDDGAFASVSLSSTYDLGRKDRWAIMMDASYYQNWLSKSESRPYETLYIIGGAGLRHTGRRSLFQLPIQVSHVVSGHTSLMTSYGISPVYLYLAGRTGNQQWITSCSAESRDYLTLDTRDGSYVSAGETWKCYLTKARHSVSVGISAHNEFTDTKIYQNSGIDGSLGGELTLPFDLSLYANTSYGTSEYDEREDLAPKDREDTELQWTVGLSADIFDRWTLDLNHRVTDNNSTFKLYEYERNMTTLSASTTF